LHCRYYQHMISDKARPEACNVNWDICKCKVQIMPALPVTQHRQMSVDSGRQTRHLGCSAAYAAFPRHDDTVQNLPGHSTSLSVGLDELVDTGGLDLDKL
jgi:hypothetical protein